MIEVKIAYERFKEIVAKDYIKFEKLNDLIYAFAQLRAVGQPVACMHFEHGWIGFLERDLAKLLAIEKT